MFQVLFSEFARYSTILTLKHGIDWTTYAQQRSRLMDVLHMSVDEYELFFEKPVTQAEAVEEDSKLDETQEQRKQRLLMADAKKIDDKQRDEIGAIPRLYSEAFMLRLLGMVDHFASISVSQPNLLNMARSIASPVQLSNLVSLLVAGSPRIKFVVIRILSALVSMKLPVELFEEAINHQMKDPESSVSQLLRKFQPVIRFKQSKFLAFVHQYILSIRQKVWVKTTLESQGQYEISCQLMKLMRTAYES